MTGGRRGVAQQPEHLAVWPIPRAADDRLGGSSSGSVAPLLDPVHGEVGEGPAQRVGDRRLDPDLQPEQQR